MNQKARKKVKDILWVKQEKCCCYCDRLMIKEFEEGYRPTKKEKNLLATLEHLNRRADKGPDRFDNTALACFECNNGRGDIDWFTYKSYKRGELSY